MWNEVTLDTPIQIDAGLEYWVGYTIDGQPTGKYPAGTDAGPAIAGYGDMISTDGITWNTLSGFGLDFNWNIEFYATEMNNVSSVIKPMIDNTVYNTPNATLARGNVQKVPVAANRDSERAFQNIFRIYRRDDSIPTYTLYATVPYVDGTSAYTYYDKYPAVDIHQRYDYKVTTLWASDIDSCEPPAYAKTDTTADSVFVYITSVNNPIAESLTNLYPNPAKDRVTITSSKAITHITVVNYLGQIVYNSKVNDMTTLTLHTASYQSGIYIVKISNESGVVTKRVTITK